MDKEITILIVDDDLDYCQIVQKSLEQKFERPKIIICGDGQECVEVFKDEQPDVVILDVMMPRMNGWEACRNIRYYEENETQGQRAIIIMVTAIGPRLNEMTSPLYDADEYIDKPANYKTLVDMVCRLLKKRQTA